MIGWLRRAAAVARVEILHVLRDRATLALVVTVPAMQVLLFGYAVNLDPRGLPLAIARDSAAEGDRLRRLVDGTGYFTVIADGLPPGGAVERVTDGRALVAIETGDPARVVVDATDATAVRPALAALEIAYWRASAEADPLAAPPRVEIERLHNPAGRTAWTIVPGLAGVVVMIGTLMLGALTLVRERERGTWEALLATPVGAGEAMAGKLAPYVALGTAQAAVVIGVGRLLFDVPVTGSLAALLIATPLYAAAHLVLGFALSAIAASQMQAVQAAVVFYLPSMLLSGFMFPFQGLPAWARFIGEILPLTHFVRAARGALLRGDGAGAIAAEMLPVALFAAGAAAVALLAYRRRLD